MLTMVTFNVTVGYMKSEVGLSFNPFRLRNPMLASLALLHLALVPFEVLLMVVDTRRIGGENVWLKPIKFDLSIAIYAASMLVVLAPLPTKERDRYSRGICIAMWAETVLIAMQAARGVTSHFNQASAFDGVVFSLMGLAILFNTFLVAKLLWRYGRSDLALPPVMRRAMALGLAATLGGSVIGGIMSVLLTHVGRHGGDFRLAHAIGLHGLQLLLGLGAVLGATHFSEQGKLRALNAAAAVHLVATFLAAWRA